MARAIETTLALPAAQLHAARSPMIVSYVSGKRSANSSTARDPAGS